MKTERGDKMFKLSTDHTRHTLNTVNQAVSTLRYNWFSFRTQKQSYQANYTAQLHLSNSKLALGLLYTSFKTNLHR